MTSPRLCLAAILGWLLIPVALAAAPGCAKKDQKGGHGDLCDPSRPCRSGLVCHGVVCKTPQEVATFERELAADTAKAEAAERKKQLQLLEASGVDPSPTAERPAPEVAPGEPAKAGSIRVSHTEGNSPIFAACRADERLLGGGCHPGSTSVAVQSSYPSEFDVRDTVGARWNCVGHSDFSPMEMEAYALCQRLTDAPVTPAAGAE